MALLGWSISHDRDVFSIEELVAKFDVKDVNPNPARFDQKKAESINGDQIRLLEAADFAERVVPYLAAADVLSEPASDADRAVLAQAAPLIQERIALLGEAPAMLGFLFVTGENLVHEADALKSLPQTAAEILAASSTALRAIPEPDWATDRVHTVLNGTLLDGLALKPRVAFGPLRVAVSGRKVSPPLFESMEILGQAETLARLDRLAQVVGTSAD